MTVATFCWQWKSGRLDGGLSSGSAPDQGQVHRGAAGEHADATGDGHFQGDGGGRKMPGVD